MRARNFAYFAALACGTMLLSAESCPLIPDADKRTVELAVVGSATQGFEARGEINVDGQPPETFNLGQDIDIRQILDDNGIDVSDVTDISLANVYVRCTRPDPVGTRAITDAHVDVARGAGSPALLLDGFTLPVNTATDWTTVPLNSAGVGVLNDALDDLLADVRADQSSNIPLTYSWGGVSDPIGADTNFDWEIRIDLNIVGSITVDIFH